MDTVDALTAAAFTARVRGVATAEQLAAYDRYFPPAERGDDVFVGARMGHVFALAKEFGAMPLDEVERLLESDVHEDRVGAVSILDVRARAKGATVEQRRALYDLYLRRHDRINTWDLVDRAAIHVVGAYAAEHDRGAFARLAASPDRWERRTALIASFALVRRGETDDALAVAAACVDDPEDTVNKAVGWLLRSIGGAELVAFLEAHAADMPRAALRAAVEKLEPDVRRRYLRAAREG
ncbi:DNA alkylation repair enzyme [Beutenbergia cavernae DSM 12333]|uniref:DNA alkylation repair enzyme n=1 Tax=Beutenbergia cavernae (strain ATCC BAA-8 / DSM 12333 / CCUG 43141 / JCM 11478 / NBRC 16432 / NCIMB 13614 / HKI 0122) TaxID=471853 RepID=C5C4X1_BEUC1|nr:DNA alkylation repair protein [Beutenbergia cavernae]ACQ80099.1 DNA alkylation repair enzyme [Beutenbergia cavernae DSM 12333]